MNEIKSFANGAYKSLPRAGPDRGFQRAVVRLLDEWKGEGTTLTDLGCGSGEYVAFINTLGWVAHGFDGNPMTPTLVPGHTHYANLSKALVSPSEWVLSLEVGEHIPPKFEDAFLANVTSNAKSKIIMSWAIPGQGGPGHVNEQPVEYIVDKMRTLGWVPDWTETSWVRKSCFLHWLRNNIVVYTPNVC